MSETIKVPSYKNDVDFLRQNKAIQNLDYDILEGKSSSLRIKSIKALILLMNKNNKDINVPTYSYGLSSHNIDKETERLKKANLKRGTDYREFFKTIQCELFKSTKYKLVAKTAKTVEAMLKTLSLQDIALGEIDKELLKRMISLETLILDNILPEYI